MQIKDLFREVKYQIELFDKNGNKIYWEDKLNQWVCAEYDEKGRVIFTKDFNGYSSIKEYKEE